MSIQTKFVRPKKLDSLLMSFSKKIRKPHLAAEIEHFVVGRIIILAVKILFQTVFMRKTDIIVRSA